MSLLVTPEEIESAWLTLCKEKHPDAKKRGDLSRESAEINEAREVLSQPSRKLEHWLNLQGKKSASSKYSAVSDSLMDLFSRIGKCLGDADAVLVDLEKSTTALGRSLHTERALDAQLNLQAQLREITEFIQAAASRFPQFEKEAQENQFDNAATTLGELKFLQKWEAECQKRLLALIAAQ